MSRRFRARRAKEIRAFLEAKGFYLANTHGDDDVYVINSSNYTVKIPSRDHKEIPRGTMDYILKMIGKCGFDKKEVLKWLIDNGYGD